MTVKLQDQSTSKYVLTPEEGRAHFEKAIPRLLGISADEFLRRHDAGEYAGVPDRPEYRNIERAIALIPLVHPESDEAILLLSEDSMMDVRATDDLGSVDFFSEEEARAFFEQEVQRLLSISSEEFFRRFDAGEYRDTPDTPEYRHIYQVVTMIPLGRPVPA